MEPTPNLSHITTQRSFHQNINHLDFRNQEEYIGEYDKRSPPTEDSNLFIMFEVPQDQKYSLKLQANFFFSGVIKNQTDLKEKIKSQILEKKMIVCNNKKIPFTQSNIFKHLGEVYKINCYFDTSKEITILNKRTEHFRTTDTEINCYSFLKNKNTRETFEDTEKPKNWFIETKKKPDLIPKNSFTQELSKNQKLFLAETNLRKRGDRIDSVEFAILFRIFKPIRIKFLQNDFLIDHLEGLEPRIYLEIATRARTKEELKLILGRICCIRIQPLTYKQQIKIYCILQKKGVLFSGLAMIIKNLKKKLNKVRNWGSPMEDSSRRKMGSTRNQLLASLRVARSDEDRGFDPTFKTKNLDDFYM